LPKPKPARKRALKKERRGKRSAAQIKADVLPVEQNDHAATLVIEVVRARHNYAKLLSMQKLARASAQAAAHVHVTSSILAAACKRAADVHDCRHKLTTGGRGFLMNVSSNKVVAWQLVKGSFNKVRFLAFLEEHLIPAMQDRPHLQHLLMGNVLFHKSADVREMLEKHDFTEPIIFNPPYHPDTNLVEMVFSSLKNMTRKRAPRNHKEIEKVHQGCNCGRPIQPARHVQTCSGREIHARIGQFSKYFVGHP
jgi:transposase